MNKYCFLLLFIGANFYVGTTKLSGQSLVAQKKTLRLMGCQFQISAVAANDTIAWEAINAGIKEIERIERLISSWDSNSQTSAINKQAGIKAVQVDQELFDLIYRAKKVSQLTQGAFDISFASMDRIWKFDGSMQQMPEPNAVQQAAAKISWINIELNREQCTVFLKEKGMRIGFGAIGKGYAANKAKLVMQKTGIVGGLVNASGDILAWGKSSKPGGWSIQIADPKQKDTALGWIQLNNAAIVTSGDYERYVTFNGKRYAHIIDPRTGYPTTGIKSVSIICHDAELADALATSVFVLGVREGLNLLNALKGVEGLIVTDQDEIISTDSLRLNFY